MIEYFQQTAKLYHVVEVNSIKKELFFSYDLVSHQNMLFDIKLTIINSCIFNISLSIKLYGCIISNIDVVTGDSWHIYNVYTLKKYQKQGFSNILMNNLFNILNRFNIKKTYLFVKTDNESAISLYKKHRFQQSGNIIGGYIRMERILI